MPHCESCHAAQKEYRTKEEERKLRVLSTLNFFLTLAGGSVSFMLMLVIASPGVNAPVRWVTGIILIASLILTFRFWVICFRMNQKLISLVPDGYTVIEKGNGAKHCHLQAPIVRDGQVGFGAGGAFVPISEFYIKAPLLEGAKGRIHQVTLGDGGQLPEKCCALVVVEILDPMGGFVFHDGYGGTYRWMWDVQSCQEVRLEDVLRAYFEFWCLQRMVFPRNLWDYSYDTPWGLQESRRESVRLMLVMLNYIGSMPGRVPAKPLNLLLAAAIEKAGLPQTNLETLRNATVLAWQDLAAKVGVKLPSPKPVPAESAGASARA